MPQSPENRLSLRRRLLRMLLPPLLGVFVVSGSLSYVLAAHFARQEYNRALYDSVESLAHQVRRGKHGLELDLPQAAESVFLWDDLDTTYYRVYGEVSGQIAGYAELSLTPDSSDDYRGVAIGDGAVRGTPVRIATLTVDREDLGERVYVQVAETQRKRVTLARQILMSVWVPQLILVAVVIVTITIGVRRGLAPLLAIAAKLEAQNHRDLNPIPDEGAPSEVHALTHALNELLVRVEAAMAAQRKFVADAAHQLRTPLTALKLNLDRALQEQNLPEVQAALKQMKPSMERTVRLSRQLLSLARAEPHAGFRKLERLDLVALAREVGAEWVPSALEHRIDLSFDAPAQALWIHGDAVLLREALSNLIDNAVKYGQPGGRVEVAVAAGPRPSLSVRDDGPGIPAPQRAKVLQRFYRGDSGGEGTGLGLAIVAEVAAFHQAELELAEGLAGHGLGVTLRFADPMPV